MNTLFQNVADDARRNADTDFERRARRAQAKDHGRSLQQLKAVEPVELTLIAVPDDAGQVKLF